MKHEACVGVDKFSDNENSKKFLSWNVERWRNRKWFNYFWRLFHVLIALYITASLPCDFVLKDFTLSIPFSEHDVSHLCVSEEKTNQLLKISDNWLFKDLLTNKQFSIEILSGSLIMLDSENRKLISNLYLMIKFIFKVYSSYGFLLDSKYAIDWTFCFAPDYRSIV